MKASAVIIGILVVIAIVFVALYVSAQSQIQSLSSELEKAKGDLNKAQSQISQLQGQISQLQSKVSELQSLLKQREQELERLKAARVARGYLYTFAMDKIGGKTELFIGVIDPATNDFVAKVPLSAILDEETYALLYNVSTGALPKSKVEVWTFRFYASAVDYLAVFFEWERGSYMLAIWPKTNEYKLVKTYDGYTRQYPGVSPDGRYIFVAARQIPAILVFDAKTFEKVAQWETIANPCDVAPSPDGKYILVPEREDKNPGRPSAAVIYDVSTGEKAAVYYFREAGAPTPPLEAFMAYWSFKNPEYASVQFVGAPLVAAIRVDVARRSIEMLKQLSVEHPIESDYEHPAVPYVFSVDKQIIVIRKSFPDYTDVKVIESPVAGGAAAFSLDGRYFYQAGKGGIAVVDTTTLEIVKTIPVERAFWVVSWPSADLLYATGKWK